MKTKTIFQSTKSVISSSADIIVATAETTASVVILGRDIVSNNLSAMRVSTIRDNHIENSTEIDESLDVCDAKLDNLEALLAGKGLTARQKARINLRIKMWEDTASTIESTSKF